MKWPWGCGLRAHLDTATAVGRRCRAAEISANAVGDRSPRQRAHSHKKWQSGSFALPKLVAVSGCTQVRLRVLLVMVTAWNSGMMVSRDEVILRRIVSSLQRG